MNERNDMRGELLLQLSDRTGRVVRQQRCANRIVRSGRLLVAQMFGGVTSGPPPSPVTHMAVGSGAGAPSDDDAALAAQRGPRKPLSAVQYQDFDEPAPGGGSVKRVRVTLTTVFEFDEANGPEPLREAGVFTAATGGVMYNRVVFEPVTKTSTFKLTLLWDIIF